MFGVEALDLNRDIAAAVLAEEEVNQENLQGHMVRVETRWCKIRIRW